MVHSLTTSTFSSPNAFKSESSSPAKPRLMGVVDLYIPRLPHRRILHSLHNRNLSRNNSLRPNRSQSHRTPRTTRLDRHQSRRLRSKVRPLSRISPITLNAYQRILDVRLTVVGFLRLSSCRLLFLRIIRMGRIPIYGGSRSLLRRRLISIIIRL